MQEPVIKISHVNIDDHMWRKDYIGLKPQMAKFICKSCRAWLNKDVAGLSTKMKKYQEILAEKSSCMKSNSDDKVRPCYKAQAAVLSSIAETEM